MTGEPAQPREGNLFDAPPGAPGAHGRLGSRSRRHAASVSGTIARGLLAAIPLGCVAGAVTAAWRMGARATGTRDHRLPEKERAARIITQVGLK